MKTPNTWEERFHREFIHKGEDGDDAPENWAWTIKGMPIEVETFIKEQILLAVQEERERVIYEIEKYVDKMIENPLLTQNNEQGSTEADLDSLRRHLQALKTNQKLP